MPELQLYLASFAIVVSLGLIVWAAFGQNRPSFSRAGSGGARMNASSTSLRDVRLQVKATDRIVAPIMSVMAGRARRFTPNGAIDAMERKIAIAGVTSTWSVERLLATKVGFSAGGFLVSLLFLSNGLTPKNLLIGVLITAGSYVLPDMSLDRRAKDRAKQIEKDLPDVLDQLTISVEAGLGFDAALSRVAGENTGPLAEEFGRMMQDRQLGMSRAEAFDKLLLRTDSPDLRHFVLALGQADKHGMPLSGVLRVQAEEMRQKRRVRAEEKALALPVKLIMPLVLCILPALFTVILGPAVFRFQTSGF